MTYAFNIEALSSARGAHAGHGTLRCVREGLNESDEDLRTLTWEDPGSSWGSRHTYSIVVLVL